jgi:serine/threonine protein kinase
VQVLHDAHFVQLLGYLPAAALPQVHSFLAGAIILEQANCNLATFMRDTLAGLRQHSLAVAQTCALVLVQQLATGLQRLHSKGLAHADLKPQNILVVWPPAGGWPIIKITDLGNVLEATVDSEDPVAPWAVGCTPTYAAPEALLHRMLSELGCQRNLPAVGVAMDVWSLGIILTELMLPDGAPHSMTRNMDPCKLVPAAWDGTLATAAQLPVLADVYNGAPVLPGAAAQLALQCLHADALQRPCMAHVVAALHAMVQS